MGLIKFAIKLVLSSLIVLLLASCSPVHRATHYSYHPPKHWKGRQCINLCLEQRNFCQMDCRASELQCYRDAQRAAAPTYQRYLHQQRRQKKRPVFNIDHFADYSLCRDSCNCMHHYRQCYQHCGGQVVPQNE